MEAEDRDQANAALLLNEKIDERVAEALIGLINQPVQHLSAFTPGGWNPGAPQGAHVVAALMEHPMVKTKIYAMAAETARMLISQAFREYGERMNAPTPTYYTGSAAMAYGYIYNADSMPKNRFF